MTGRGVLARLLALALGAGCGAPPEPAAEGRRGDLVARYQEAPLHEIQARQEALRGRDDLAAVDEREALRLAWRNRSPAAVSEDVSGLDPALQDQERALRAAWRAEHVAFSWDNLDPDAQLEPAPEGLSLTWLTLAGKLPLARNGRRFEEPWIADYFSRKRWYRPTDGPLALSIIDQVQLQRIRETLERLDRATLEQHLATLPLPGMSPEEAALEARLARTLLEERAAP